MTDPLNGVYSVTIKRLSFLSTPNDSGFQGISVTRLNFCSSTDHLYIRIQRESLKKIFPLLSLQMASANSKLPASFFNLPDVTMGLFSSGLRGASPEI